MTKAQDVLELLGEVESNPLITTRVMTLPDFALSAMEDTSSDLGQAIAMLSALDARSYSGAPMISDLIAMGRDSRTWDDLRHFCLIRAGDDEALDYARTKDLPLSNDLWQRDFPMEMPDLTGLSREGRMRAVMSSFAESVLVNLAPRIPMALANTLGTLTENRISQRQKLDYNRLFFQLGLETAQGQREAVPGIAKDMFRGSEFLSLKQVKEFLDVCEEYNYEWALSSFDWAAAPLDYQGATVMARLTDALEESPW